LGEVVATYKEPSYDNFQKKLKKDFNITISVTIANKKARQDFD
jgi:hypothetical protein